MHTITINKQAYFNYLIKDKYEAGLVLLGSEVKPIKHGQVNISNTYVILHEDALYLCNLKINLSSKKNLQHNSNSLRKQKLLLHLKEINKIRSQLNKDGITIIPTRLYINSNGLVKVTIAIAVGKKMYDKRLAIKTREWNRQKSNLLKHRV